MRAIIKLSALFIAGTMLFSCSRQLDLKPTDSIIEENAFRDIPSLERGIVGVYATFNGAYDNDIYATSLYSDEAFLPTENTTGRGVGAHRWQTDPGTGEVTASWAAYYFGIDRANRILAAAEGIGTSNAAEEQDKKRIRGEAFALRAFGHLQLLINFAEGYEPTALGVAYMEKSGIAKPARITVAADFAKIKADLQSAQGLIPASFSSATRITIPAVYAIQARAALYSKSWDDAINAATGAINAVPLATAAQYPLIWKDQSNAGVIWKNRREAGQSRLGDTYYDRSQQKIVYGVSKELLNTLNATTDLRYNSTVLARGTGRYSVAKYIGGDANEPGRADIKVFRTAEMYLIRAEAYAEKNQLAQGATDLNALRTARITGYVAQAFTTKDALVSEIYLERFRELAFEGQRMGDLRRRLLPVTRIPEDVINAPGASTLNPADKAYYYPIPEAEMKANENMVQNAGYR